ncbi:MAG: hypothetical protein ACTSVB_04465 [Candidatus Heimdallarchaeaceae archaeon]
MEKRIQLDYEKGISFEYIKKYCKKIKDLQELDRAYKKYMLGKKSKN